MTIYKTGDKVRRRGDNASVYTVEDVTGDEYRLTLGEGDHQRTSFARGFELEPDGEPASSPAQTPAVDERSIGSDSSPLLADARGKLAEEGAGADDDNSDSSNAVEKPEAETAGGSDLSGPAAPADQVAEERLFVNDEDDERARREGLPPVPARPLDNLDQALSDVPSHERYRDAPSEDDE